MDFHDYLSTPVVDQQLYSVLYQVAVKIDTMHKEGFIHRDIKPKNIFINYDDGKHVAYLGDMGLVIPAVNKEGDKFAGTLAYLPIIVERKSLLNTVHQDYCAFAMIITHIRFPIIKTSLEKGYLYYVDEIETMFLYRDTPNLTRPIDYSKIIDLNQILRCLLTKEKTNYQTQPISKYLEDHSKCFQALVSYLRIKAGITEEYTIVEKNKIPEKKKEELKLDEHFKTSITIKSDK